MINIIDIGSNTIRLVTYDRGKCLANTGLSSDIIGDTKKGILTENGIEKLCGVLSYLKGNSSGNVHAFGTYAIRVLKNKDEVKARVLEKTGIDIDILSGKQEAEYDFYALLNEIGTEESGIGIELGGGSAQILIFEKGKLVDSSSHSIGCKRIKNRFAYGRRATKEDLKKIKEYIKNDLSHFSGRKTDMLYMMGGTAKAAMRLYRFLYGESRDIIELEELKKIIDYAEAAEAGELKRVLKSRYDSIATGMVIIQALAEFFEAEKICVKMCGVRDGYILRINE